MKHLGSCSVATCARNNDVAQDVRRMSSTNESLRVPSQAKLLCECTRHRTACCTTKCLAKNRFDLIEKSALKQPFKMNNRLAVKSALMGPFPGYCWWCRPFLQDFKLRVCKVSRISSHSCPETPHSSGVPFPVAPGWKLLFKCRPGTMATGKENYQTEKRASHDLWDLWQLCVCVHRWAQKCITFRQRSFQSRCLGVVQCTPSKALAGFTVCHAKLREF